MIKKVLPFVLCAVLLMGCEAKKERKPFPRQSKLSGLAAVVKLDAGENQMVMRDFFLDPKEIDSIRVHPILQGILSEDREIFSIKGAGPELPPLSEMKVWLGDESYSIFLKKPAKIPVSLTFDPQDRTYSTVQVAGSLNDWNPSNTPMIWEEGVWKADFLLNPGLYQYQLVVDGEWMLDPSNPDSADNNIGGFNSVLKAGDPAKKNTPFLYTQAPVGEEVLILQDGIPEDYLLAWENHRLSDEYVTQRGDSMLIRIPGEAEDLERSHLRLWAWNAEGLGNDLLIPLHKGKVLEQSEKLSRLDKHNTRLYFMLVDRFNNGTQDNDQPVEDKRVDPKANYQGGDLVGIQAKLQESYFSELNMNMLWLSPITQNPQGAYQEFPEPRDWYSGYHGYWPVSSSQVDHRFGTSEELTQLVDKAHEREVGIILDFVANHVHENHPMYRAHPDWATALDLPDGSKNIRIWDEQRLTTWFDTFLPSLDFANEKVTALQSDSAMFWIKKYGLDGFRHDATKHIPESFWRSLTYKLKKDIVEGENRPVLQIGETFGSRELIDSYIGAGQLDAQFDFNLYFDARAVLSTDHTPFTLLKNSLQASLDMYGYHNLMGNITGNHDMPRFISLAGGALRFDEDPKMAGWKREIGVGDPEAYKRLEMLHAFIFTIPGIPVIYYGDEIGMPGAGDPDNRRMMKFDFLTDEEFDLKTSVSKLAGLRKDRLSLIYGDTRIIEATEDVFVYSRSYLNEGVIVAFNKGSDWNSIQIELPPELIGLNTVAIEGSTGVRLAEEDEVADLTLPPNSWMILIREKNNPEAAEPKK